MTYGDAVLISIIAIACAWALPGLFALMQPPYQPYIPCDCFDSDEAWRRANGIKKCG